MRRLSYKDELVDYLKRNISKGYTLDSLKFALANQGYSKVSIDQAIDQMNKELAEQVPPIVKEKPKITYELYDDKNRKVRFNKSDFWDNVKSVFKKREY